MEVDIKELTLTELLELYRAYNEFIEFLSVEENAEVESRKK
jgi:hypothetical protein